MAVPRDYTDEEIKFFLTEELGNMSATAKRMSVTRAALKNRIDSTPELKLVLEELVQSILDKAEDNVFRAVVDQGELKESKFLLTTLGKERGYTTKSEVDANIITGEEAARKISEARARAMAALGTPNPEKV